MKLPYRILLVLMSAALILSLPFVLSSPDLLDSTKTELMNEGDEDEGEEIDFGRLIFPSALADDLEVVTAEAGQLMPHPEWALPLDFSVPPMPNPAGYTETGYTDDTINVQMETREMSGTTVHVAHVQISDPSQLRTAIAGDKVTKDKTSHVITMATYNHAVIAMNGDYFSQVPEKKLFEFRMTQKRKAKTNKIKDTLIIDRNGDFHLFVRSAGLADYAKAHSDMIVNAFMFGPALVIDGQVQKCDTEYSYAPNYKNPRSAIGQTGPLSYIMVVVEGRGEDAGVTHQELAEIMGELGCLQAYNLDGGNTSELMLLEGYKEGSPKARYHFKGDQNADERPQSDIIYFATAVPESLWN